VANYRLPEGSAEASPHRARGCKEALAEKKLRKMRKVRKKMRKANAGFKRPEELFASGDPSYRWQNDSVARAVHTGCLLASMLVGSIRAVYKTSTG